MSRATDKSVLRDFLGGGLRQVAAVMGGLITFPVIARMLDADALGAWQLLGATSFLVGFADLGLSTAVQRAAVKDDAQRTRDTIGVTLLVLAVLLPIFSAIGYVLVLDVPADATALRDDVAKAGVVAVLAGSVFGVSQPYRMFVLAKGGVRAIANARTIGAVAQMVTTIGLLQLWPHVIAPATGLLVGYSIETTITLRAARALDPLVPFWPRWIRQPGYAATAFRDGAAGFAINLATATALRVDLFVISRVAPLAVVAAYGVAGRAVEMAYLIAKQAVVALTPRLARKAERESASRIGTLVFAGVIVSGMMALTIAGQGLLVAWVGEIGRGTTPAVVMAVLGSAAMIAASYEVAGNMVMLNAKSGWECAIPIVAGNALNLVISISLSPVFGIWAVAGSTVAGNLVTCLLMWRRALGIMGWTLGTLARVLAPVLVAGGIAAGLSVALRPFAAGGGLHSFAACTVASAAGALVIALTLRLQRPTEPTVTG